MNDITDSNYPFQAGEGSLGTLRSKSKRIDEKLGTNSLTEKQAKVFQFIKKHSRELGFPPSIREVAIYFGVSLKAARDHLNAISKKNYIKVFPKRARGIEIIKDPFASENETNDSSLNKKVIHLEEQFTSVPLLGTIKAGIPALTEENFEDDLQLPKHLLPHTGVFFALRVSGDSMRDAGILDGDIAILQKIDDFKTEVRNGDIVAALIDSEVTLKTYLNKNNIIELHPENKAYKPIILDKRDNPSVMGKLKGIYRKY